MMQEALPDTRPLQNHLPVVRHFTTDAGLCMPQYLPHAMWQPVSKSQESLIAEIDKVFPYEHAQ